MTELTAIDENNYENVLQMLDSKDEEARNLALSCLENVDFDKSALFILMLRKNSAASLQNWNEFAPETVKKLVEIGSKADDVPSNNEIQKIGRKSFFSKNNPDRARLMTFYSNAFAKDIRISLVRLGYDFIDEQIIEVIIKSSDGDHKTINSK